MTVNLNQLGQKAKTAFSVMSRASTEQKNQALREIAGRLIEAQNEILMANHEDIEIAKQSKLPAPLIDRLSLVGRLQTIADDVEDVISLPDPIGETFEEMQLPNGLHLYKKRVPIGVLGVIYEARPNVTIDVAALAIKTGNCAILRGGKEALRTNKKIVEVIQQSLQQADLPSEAIQFIDDPNRENILSLLRLHQYVDLIIPRGGAELHRFCRENSTIPVITGGIGICHLFVDESADLDKSLEVIFNAKTQRPTVCNALDTVLVHRNIASHFLPELVRRMRGGKVEMHLDPKALKIVNEGIFPSAHIVPASESDWDKEWLSLVLGVKVVEHIEEAIAHIQKHSSGHSDGILTANLKHSKQFVDEIDSAAVYVNASTRFTDGGQFGLGAEVAISTQKLHARGPMGLKELTSYKWVVQGDYHVRP